MKAPRILKVDLEKLDDMLRKKYGTEDKDLFTEGPNISIRLTYKQFNNIYKLKSYRNGKLIYRIERTK